MLADLDISFDGSDPSYGVTARFHVAMCPSCGERFAIPTPHQAADGMVHDVEVTCLCGAITTFSPDGLASSGGRAAAC